MQQIYATPPPFQHPPKTKTCAVNTTPELICLTSPGLGAHKAGCLHSHLVTMTDI